MKAFIKVPATEADIVDFIKFCTPHRKDYSIVLKYILTNMHAFKAVKCNGFHYYWCDEYPSDYIEFKIPVSKLSIF